MNIVIAYSQQNTNRCVMGDTEQDHMYTVSEALYGILAKDKRFNPYLMPKLTGDTSANLHESVRLSNEFIQNNDGTGVHIELHSDAGGYAQGCSGLYVSENGKTLVTPIIEQLEALTPWSDVGVRQRNNLYVLNNTIAVAGLIEISFHDNQEEATWIHNCTQDIANAIAKGIYAYAGMQPPVVDPNAWKYEGLTGLYQAGLITEFEDWAKKIDEPMPVWATTIILNRIYQKLKG